MRSSLTSHSVEHSKDEEITLNTEMFQDADRLDEIAYQIIEFGMTDNDVWQRFSEAKGLADAKRTAAYQDWIRINRAKRS